MRISDWSADVCSSDLNTIATTETGASLAWSDGATLTGGGSAAVSQVYMPDDMGVIDVAVINSYVIVIPVQEDGYQGRFYWIDPGEIVVDPLNRSEEHTSELQSLMRISYAVFCLKQKTQTNNFTCHIQNISTLKT